MRLLSYNIHKGIGGRDRRYDLSRISQAIEHENPDLICLQEVTRHAPRTRHEDQPELLASQFGVLESSFQMNVHYRKGGYGNLLLSRWPLESKHHISLRHGRRKPRGAQIAIVETPQGLLRLVNWHLGLANVERFWQVEHLLNHPLFDRGSDLPTLIVGDTNDWRNRFGKGGLADQGFEEITMPAARFRSFPAYMPVLSLDKAFFRGGITIRDARTVRSRLTRAASDHLPLIVDFHL